MSFTRNIQDQERLIDCVRRALAQMDAGETVHPLELCREHPHLAGPLAEVLGLTAQLPELQQAALREDPLAGAVLAGRYRLAECLGRGAMGVVYRGEDQELRRDVAVKILDVRLFRDPEAERRFQREAEALAALQHAHVVAVFDRGRTPEGIHFLVMERLEGATLAALLQRLQDGEPAFAALRTVIGAEPAESHWPRLCARWACDLARGLAAAHAHQLVHRDVKPSNVFLARPGRAVLLDFGIAARATDQRLTATQTTLGTPWYMAPEQVRGGVALAEPTLDVYGLGATLYHLLAGRPPYEGDATAVLAALLVHEPTPLASVRADLPRDLVAIVEKCLERDPARRYQQADALAADLQAFLEHRPVSARPLGAFGRRMRQWRRAPAKPVAVAAVGLALVVAAVAGPILWRQREAERRATKEQLYATLPSLLAIEGWPDERVLSELRDEHESAVDLLDRILELDPTDVPALLFRASLRLDLDDRSAAAAGMQAIARAVHSPYLQQLAARYESADPAQPSAMAVDLRGLPEPTTSEECFVAGFHELRARHVRGFAERADALLARAAGDYLPARELRLMSVAALADQTGGEEQAGLIQFLYDETVRLEVIYGRPTARTLAMRGLAFVFMKRYAEAAAALRASLVLRPARHGPYQNLGVALWNLGDLDGAQQSLETAQQLRPFAWNTKYALAQVARDRGDFAQAYAWAEQVPTEGHAGQAWKQPDLVGGIALAEATTWLREDPARSRAAAARSVEAYDRAFSVRRTERARQRRAIAAALQTGEPQSQLVEFLDVLLDDPDDAYHLATLAYLLPRGGLDARQAAWLGALLRRLAVRRAPGDEVLRARLEAEIEQGLAPYRK